MKFTLIQCISKRGKTNKQLRLRAQTFSVTQLRQRVGTKFLFDIFVHFFTSKKNVFSATVAVFRRGNQTMYSRDFSLGVAATVKTPCGAFFLTVSGPMIAIGSMMLCRKYRHKGEPTTQLFSET